MQRVILLLAALVIMTSQAPVFTITGTVFDESGTGIAGVTILEKGTTNSVTSDLKGSYTISVKGESSILTYSYVGYKTQEKKVRSSRQINVYLIPEKILLEEVVMEAEEAISIPDMAGSAAGVRAEKKAYHHTGAVNRSYPPATYQDVATPYYGNEDYEGIEENRFLRPFEKPLSTFSIDVDAASYSNVRRFLNNGNKPPKDAVRVEEMINYFSYDYPQPKGNDPFSITTNYMPAPWNEKHHLVQIGLQGKKIATEDLPASNLVFLLDVSGSMNSPNKLPLLKSSLKMLVNQMRKKDKVSIVVYAGAAGLVLEPTNGDDKQKIIDALDNLQAGGSTAGGAGILLAYKIAKQNLVEGGNNRVILATDGDFNVGASSNEAMEDLIEMKRKEGVFLTVLGFGMGNYKDSKMEILADKGNGNYAYIDNLKEAQKVLVNEFGGTLFTIAKDVKIQVEFNPAYVQAYRLIGYENRKLKDEDFNNDAKDAGELGSGHTVTALYEIVPVGVQSNYVGSIDPLKYQKQINQNTTTAASDTDEILTVKFRYKAPDGDKSKLITKTLKQSDETRADDNIQWAASVASLGMLLRDSEFKGDLTYDQVVELARKSRGSDEYGYRSEFIQLARLAGNIVQ
ncbi:von Willebrand factor type A domain-containing protein [Marinoscillum sp. MHG1-6]|uniref:vWA domain-containing protein n=1 Tax=Marinoscillum sp. MHG1-6 TaxID=2959627 RepID=UPI0021585E87|nr:von Willebrand factor type A domain-containing protein [Marinoscillum sp. MHG1-6]